jgi:hypothetical protein
MQKQHLYLVTLLFLGVSAVLALSKGGLGNATTSSRSGPGWTQSEQAGASSSATQITEGIVAYWFHGDIRCETDRQIEQQARRAIQNGFGQRTETGELQFRAVNTDRPGNGHFNDDFQLRASSLVVVDYHQGEIEAWRNLEQVWEIEPGTGAFDAYVRQEVESFLGEHAEESAGATH